MQEYKDIFFGDIDYVKADEIRFSLKYVYINKPHVCVKQVLLYTDGLNRIEINDPPCHFSIISISLNETYNIHHI